MLAKVGLLAIAAISYASAQQCYSMDGQKLDSRYQPCFPDNKYSGCCMLNGTQGDGQQNDICLDSGLCQSTSGWYASFLYINGCTDPTGKSDDCPKICNAFGSEYSWNVQQCQPGIFCCRAASDTKSCCENNSTTISTSHIGSLLLPGSSQLLNTTYNFTTSPPVNSSNINQTCADAGQHSGSPANICPADHTAVVGGALGGILGTALISVLALLVWSLHSRRHLRNDLLTMRSNLTSTKNAANNEKVAQSETVEARRQAGHVTPQSDRQGAGYAMSGMTENHGAHGWGWKAPAPSYHATTPPTEIGAEGLPRVSELGNESAVELISEVPKRG